MDEPDDSDHQAPLCDCAYCTDPSTRCEDCGGIVTRTCVCDDVYAEHVWVSP